MADGDYLVEPAKPWHKTRLTAEEWFLRNPPHVWRTLDAAVEHYMASEFVLVGRSTEWEARLTGEGYAVLRARSRYTFWRYFFRTMLPWTIFTLGVASVYLIPRYVHMITGGEQLPYITLYQHPDGSGRFLEERQKGEVAGNAGAQSMVHPETGQTGWDGCPDEYIQNIVESLQQQADEQGRI